MILLSAILPLSTTSYKNPGKPAKHYKENLVRLQKELKNAQEYAEEPLRRRGRQEVTL